MMTGNGVMHNGTAVLDDYGHNLDRLKVRVCVRQTDTNKRTVLSLCRVQRIPSLPYLAHLCII